MQAHAFDLQMKRADVSMKSKLLAYMRSLLRIKLAACLRPDT